VQREYAVAELCVPGLIIFAAMVLVGTPRKRTVADPVGRAEARGKYLGVHVW